MRGFDLDVLKKKRSEIFQLRDSSFGFQVGPQLLRVQKNRIYANKHSRMVEYWEQNYCEIRTEECCLCSVFPV